MAISNHKKEKSTKQTHIMNKQPINHQLINNEEKHHLSTQENPSTSVMTKEDFIYHDNNFKELLQHTPYKRKKSVSSSNSFHFKINTGESDKNKKNDVFYPKNKLCLDLSFLNK